MNAPGCLVSDHVVGITVCGHRASRIGERGLEADGRGTPKVKIEIRRRASGAGGGDRGQARDQEERGHRGDGRDDNPGRALSRTRYGRQPSSIPNSSTTVGAFTMVWRYREGSTLVNSGELRAW